MHQLFEIQPVKISNARLKVFNVRLRIGQPMTGDEAVALQKC